MGHVHSSYILNAGGEQQALADLQRFYACKHALDRPHDSLFALRMVAEHVSCTTAEPFTVDELRHCLNTFKQGKSAGEDGVPYEFLHVVVQTDLVHAFLCELNSVLDGSRPVPPTWFEGRLTFLPKVSKPGGPKDLRPIVLTPTTGKCFTKMLMNRLREQHAFPATKAGQLCAQPGCQLLDGSLAMQRLVHVSNKWRLPLVACKLDISAAFDSLHHSGIARFFTTCKPMREIWLLQYIICHGVVHLSMGDSAWA